MEAQTLNCPNCGAAISSAATRCLYCESRLATVACPSCFGMLFRGSKHCPHCGAPAADAALAGLATLQCPRCRLDMKSIKLGSEQMRECDHCNGLWVEVAAFERICASREEQAAVLGAASPAPAHEIEAASGNQIRYSPCPQCGQLMNRINFARCSGTIVDICKGHGTWFDQDELSAIIQFIRGGGLEMSRQKEKLDIESAREQLRYEQMVANQIHSRDAFSSDDERIGGFSAARGLLKFLIE